MLSGAMDRLPIDEKKKVTPRTDTRGCSLRHMARCRLSSPHGPSQVEMDKSIILLGDACETCERIFSSPVSI